MVLWWLLNVVLIAVVLPIVLILLRGVIAPAVEIKATVGALVDAAPALIADLEDVGELVETQRLVHDATGWIGRYATAVTEIADTN